MPEILKHLPEAYKFTREDYYLRELRGDLLKEHIDDIISQVRDPYLLYPRLEYYHSKIQQRAQHGKIPKCFTIINANPKMTCNVTSINIILREIFRQKEPFLSVKAVGDFFRSTGVGGNLITDIMYRYNLHHLTSK